MVVETLDSNAAAAITPRNAPAAAGTQSNPDRALRIVTVIDGQGIR